MGSSVIYNSVQDNNSEQISMRKEFKKGRKKNQRRYINFKKDLEPLTSKFTVEQVESLLISLWLREEGITTVKNKLVNNRIYGLNSEDVESVANHFKKRKIQINQDVIMESFDLLTNTAERDQHGQFYTPALIADFLSEQAIDETTNYVCDPACGSGSLLISSAKRIHSLSGLNFSEILEKKIYGIDIDRNNTERTKLMLLVTSILMGDDVEQINLNVVTNDSLKVEFEKLFPKVFDENSGFDAVVCNPPYSLVTSTNSGKKGTKTIKNAYLPFINLIFRIGKPQGSKSSYVVPLSLAHSKDKDTKQMRKNISKQKGTWKFSFYDRSPDSLFGDNVKTRNTIFTFNRSDTDKTRFFSTNLLRWSFENRHDLFSKIKYTEISGYDITEGIPRIGTPEQMESLRKLSDSKLKIGNNISSKSIDSKQSSLGAQNINDKRFLFYYSTAYNWLPIFKSEIEGNDTDNGGTLRSILCRAENDADFLYACLNSKVAYWYWLVHGDGFHINFKFIQSLPFNPNYFSQQQRNKLERLGEELSKCVVNHPTKKYNAGRTITNYNVLACSDILKLIDDEVASILGLDDSFIEYIRNFVFDFIKAGRTKYKNKEFVEEQKISAKKEHPKHISRENKEASKLSKEEWREFTKSVWYIANTSHESHPAMFPIEIPERLIKMFSFRQETVLDPFCGIGTTGKASIELGRKFIGVDTNESYIKIAKENTRAVDSDEIPLFYNKSSKDLGIIENDSVDLIVTSPPYWNKADYGDIEGNIGSISNYNQFIREIKEVFQECHRVLRPDRRMCIVTANVHQYTQEGLITFPLATDFLNVLREVGFIVMNEIIWSKDGTGGKWGSYGKQRPIFGSYPYPPNFLFKNVHEYILIVKKPPVVPKPKKGVLPYKDYL